MFARRVQKSCVAKIREALWPSLGWKRLLAYYRHRVGRLSGSSRSVASGFATGVAVSFTPFVGLHIAMGALTCYLTRSSILAMVLGTLIAGNIWTLPLALFASLEAGRFMMGR